jgi:4'-phosphopantetheinyl transferase
MTSIDIFFTSFEQQMEPSLFEGYLSLLSPDQQEVNARYIRWQNRHAHLFGRLLLVEALKMHGVETGIWNYVAYDACHRPYLTLQEYDFNISHSANLVVCAIGKNIRLGIDVEENREVNLDNFRHVMTPGQWNEINKAVYPLKEFYKYWTIKESVIKADGRGFFIPLDKLELKSNTMQYEDRLWFVQGLAFNSRYSAALATDQLSAFNMHYMDFYKSYAMPG